MLIPAKVDFGTKNVTRDKVQHGIMIIKSVHQKKNHQEIKKYK